MLLVSYIQQYFNTSITVLTNRVWKLLIVLFKVPNTGVFTVQCFVQVKPNAAEGDSMDVRSYVHIKRVPGGSCSECALFKGTICTKNVANKKVGRGLFHNSSPVLYGGQRNLKFFAISREQKAIFHLKIVILSIQLSLTNLKSQCDIWTVETKSDVWSSNAVLKF